MNLNYICLRLYIGLVVLGLCDFILLVEIFRPGEASCDQKTEHGWDQISSSVSDTGAMKSARGSV